MTNQLQNSNGNNKFNLEKRTSEFAIACLSLSKKIRLTAITTPIVTQFIRSATSIGANYREANGADSKKDFHAKISICKKESKETEYWISILESMYPEYINNFLSLHQEAHELSLIFGAINRH